jgi:hypothetical protein
MKKEQLKKWSDTHNLSRIVEIKTKEHIRRGLLRGVQRDGKLVFSWIPELADGVKRIENLDMDVVTVLCNYEPHQIISIKQI